MTYSIIRPPFDLAFESASKKTLREYATWFHSVAPTRIAELTNAVKTTPGYEDWEPTGAPESLERLGRWFEGQVETRKRRPEEIAELEATLSFPIDVPQDELTNRTFSLAVDIGMYFGRVVLENLQGTRWDQPLSNKRFVDYGQPVIMGFGTVPLNPVRVLVTTAYRVSKKKPADLSGLYAIWARKT